MLNSEGSPFAMQPPVLVNRFIINLRSLNSASSSQGSSARQHWSRFSAPNFHISGPESFLGNIGEDLQHGQEPADADLDGHHDMDILCLNPEGSPGAEPEETSTTPGSYISRPADTQVSLQIPSGSNRYERTPLHLGQSPGQPLRLRNTS